MLAREWATALAVERRWQPYQLEIAEVLSAATDRLSFGKTL